MPDAGRTHGPPATKKAGGSHHRLGRNNRHSLRDGLRLIARSPWCAGLLATIACKLVTRKLDPSVGGSGPHAFAVREAVVVGALKARSTPSRPPHPVSDVRDDREPPLLWNQDAGRETWISVKRKWNIFARGAGQGKSG